MANLEGGTKTLYDELVAHIQKVTADPSTALNERLVDECATFLAVPLANDKVSLVGLIGLLSDLLPTLQQDPSPPLRLLTKLVQPFTFEEILSLQPPVDFVSGLDLSAQPYHGLMLQLLQKAAVRGQDAAILAGLPLIVAALVNLWLCTPDTGNAQTAGELIVKLLSIDHGDTTAAVDTIASPDNEIGHGQGLMWKRLFGDKDVYELLFARTTIMNAKNDPYKPQLSSKERSVAQSRLLSILPEIGRLDWSYITTSHHPEVESRYGLPRPNSGLLEYACSHMVNFKEDLLVFMGLLEFWTKLILRADHPSSKNNLRSQSLDYLIEHGHHQRVLSILVKIPGTSNPAAEVDELESRLLVLPAASYISAYVSKYKEDFLTSDTLCPTLERINQELAHVSGSNWAAGRYSTGDLQILASLPRIALLPTRTSSSNPKSSVMLELPPGRVDAPALNALSHVFSGMTDITQTAKLNPEQLLNANDNVVPMEIDSGSKAAVEGYWNDPIELAEAAAAFAVYYSYINAHRSFFEDLTDTASIVAMPDNALAATNVLKSILTAQWAPPPSQDRANTEDIPRSIHDLPSARQIPVPDSVISLIFPADADEESKYTLAGIRSLFASMNSMRLFEWALLPPQRFTHLVGGRGDPEGSAYRLATAKYDLGEVIYSKLKALLPHVGDGQRAASGKPLRQAVQKLLDQFDARQRQGIWGEREVGHRIATLEM